MGSPAPHGKQPLDIYIIYLWAVKLIKNRNFQFIKNDVKFYFYSQFLLNNTKEKKKIKKNLKTRKKNN